MSGRVRASRLAYALVLTGCTLARAPLVPPRDAGPVDAATQDAASVDARAPEVDAAHEGGVGRADAGDPDAGAPLDAGPCVPVGPERCNGRDDDCAGGIDDGVACGACVRLELGGRVYQSCPVTTGLDAWSGVCARLGDGYGLAIFEAEAESNALADRLAVGDPALVAGHWIGANDFAVNGTFVWADHARVRWTPTFAGVAPADFVGMVALLPDGRWQEQASGDEARVLCEADPLRPVCTPRASDDAACDGADDDCDGQIDEDCAGTLACASRTFWDHVYFLCATPTSFAGARDGCRAVGGDLAVVLDRFENDLVAAMVGPGGAWIGLAQRSGGARPDAGWAWIDGAALDYAAWFMGQPDDSNGSENDMENEAIARDDGLWADRGGTTASLCEAPTRVSAP